MNEEEQVSREEMAEHLARKEPALQIMNKDYENQRAQTFAHAHNPLILRTKLTELAEYSHIALQQFPKRERFILCADIKNAVFDALKLTIRMERRYHKKTTLQDIDVEIDFLRVLIREAGHRLRRLSDMALLRSREEAERQGGEDSLQVHVVAVPLRLPDARRRALACRVVPRLHEVLPRETDNRIDAQTSRSAKEVFMELMVFQLFLTLLSVVLTSALGVYVTRLNRKYDGRESELQAIEQQRKKEELAKRNGIKAILRDRVIQTDIHFSRTGEISLQEKENVQMMYEAYHDLGGNDIATASYKRVIALPISQEEHIS